MKVSVVLSVFNIDISLYRCLDSIKNQTLDNIEVIICIPKIFDKKDINKVRKYIKKIKNITILKGIDDNINLLRNKSIDISTGEYLIFINNNELFENTALEKYYLECINKKLDILTFDYKLINENRIEQEKDTHLEDKIKFIDRSRNISDEIYEGIFFYELLLNKGFTMEDLNIFMFRSNFIKSKHIYFYEKIHYEPSSFIINSIIMARYIKYDASFYSIKQSISYLYDHYKEYHSIHYDIYKLNSMIDILGKMECENKKIFIIYYLMNYLYKCIDFITDIKNNDSATVILNFLNENKNVLLNSCTRSRFCIESDIIANCPQIYNKIEIKEKYKFNSNEYKNIRKIYNIIDLIEKKECVDLDIISKIKELTLSSNIFKKYLSFDNIFKFIGHDYEKNKEIIVSNLYNLINDIVYETDPNIIKYDYMNEKFEMILFN